MRSISSWLLVALVALPLGSPAEVPPVPVTGDSAAWRATLERIATGVVSIKVDSTRAFDTEWNQSGQATGFVVDAQRGLILTNRHVVTPGPVRAEALFLNQEEVDLVPVYRDPVHDFGFFRYDPDKLRYIQPAELPLDPAGAQVGREVRVVGNDAGEQLSILSGTIARLRRRAPDYGTGKYNDFNTFYLQAASGTSGGSSGSPVVDIRGHVVALNAGGASTAASSFFLPLDRIERALQLLQQGEAVSRGTLASIFVHQRFDELRRLGLQDATEAEVRRRFPDQTGMLVVQQIVPGGMAENDLQVGDILVRVDGALVTEFVPLANVLDARVGDTVNLEIERNGSVLSMDLPVTDLHAITPDEYLQFGDAVVHKLSYQLARHLNRPMEGAYVANPGYVLGSAGVPRGSVIVAVGDRPVADLDDLEQALDQLADGERAALRFFTFEDPAASKLRLMRMDRRWFPAKRCARNDASGLWPCDNLADGPPPTAAKSGSAKFVSHKDRRVRAVAQGLVMVNYDMPYTISGVSEQHYYGTGAVVDAERGYVVVDRNTVPEAMGDVFLTFGGEMEIPGDVAYVHPTHNLALLSYDPALLEDTPVEAVKLASRIPEPGEELWVVGLRADNKLVFQTTEVGSIEPLFFPLSRTMRFRDTNLETLALVNGPADIDGVIVDRRGFVVSLWSSFAYQGGGELNQENKGVPAEYVTELLELARDERELISLEVEWRQMPLSAARKFGLDDAGVRRLADHDPDRRQALAVVRTVAGTPAAEALLPGDILLGINGRPVTRFREVELAVQRQAEVELDILRNGEPLRLEVATVALDGRGVRRALIWAGALLQAPYRDMAAQRGIEPEGGYVAYFSYGSPAARYGLFAGRRIVEVDGVPAENLDRFLELVAGRADRESVRLKTIIWNGTVEVLTMKLDQTYWPASQVIYADNRWQRVPASVNPAVASRTRPASQ
ncbi:MAG: PDZ domain-containing protein [Gammaproteobacteria bacterium]|nr:PDZ domain-containing protein [Gammaproteobacteria bacterium]